MASLQQGNWARMRGPLKRKLVAWQQGLTARIGGDISTPEARKAAALHYQFVDHGFLRGWWRNFHRVAEGVYRSNQPSADQLRDAVARHGLRAVLNLRGKTQQSFYLFEAEVCAELGVDLVDLSLSASTAPPREKFAQLIGVFRTIPKPFVIHCKSGADRTGIASALYQHVIDGVPIALAKRQLSFRYLHVARSPAGIQDHILRLYERAHQRSGVGFEDWVATDYDPVAVTASFARWRKGLRDLS
jgi:predicted protein tyrosine phosphatase